MTHFHLQLKWPMIILTAWCIALFGLGVAVWPAYSQSNNQTFEIELASLGYSTEVLISPADSATYYFSLPANWDPQDGSYIQLNLDYLVNTQTNTMPAMLEVRLNDETLHIERFNSSLTTSLRIDIPPDNLRLAEESDLNQLTLNFMVDGECITGQQVSLVVQSSSKLVIVYQERPLSLDLALYPKPLYYDWAFEEATTRFVLPTQPNSYELEASAMIAAKLGNLTGNKLNLEANLGATGLVGAATRQNLLVIGTPERMPLLPQLEWPVALNQRRLSLTSQMPTAVTSVQPFSYTVIVENTSPLTQSLTVEDQLSPLINVESCQQCTLTGPGQWRWVIEALEPGQIISTVIQAQPDESLAMGIILEHTASLFNEAGQIINVDTLTTSLAIQTDTSAVVSPPKSPYFFSLENRGVPETDGLVQIIASPWNSQRAIIVISGLNDTVVLQAARALAGTNSMPGMRGQFALIQATRPVSTSQIVSPQDVPLSQLNYRDITMRGRVEQDTLVRFKLPRGVAFGEEPYLALHSAHGAALNVLSPTIEISLNNSPIKSVVLQAENEQDSWSKIFLPTQLLKPGDNLLRLRLAADWPECEKLEIRNRLWLTLYKDSFFHLVYYRKSDEPLFNLADYPLFLATQPNLSDLAVLLPSEVTQGQVTELVRMMSLMGDATQGDDFVPKVNLDDTPNPKLWHDYNLVLIGRPTRNPYMALINDKLPQSFVPGQDTIQQQVGNVIFRLPPDFDLGNLQLLPAPWNPARPVLAATGTTDTGVLWSLRALNDTQGLTRQLQGNLATLISPGEIRTTDTRQLPNTATLLATPTPPLFGPATLIAEATITPTATPTSEMRITPTDAANASVATPPGGLTSVTADYNPPNPQTPIWILGLLSFSILVAATALGMIIWQRRH